MICSENVKQRNGFRFLPNLSDSKQVRRNIEIDELCMRETQRHTQTQCVCVCVCVLWGEFFHKQAASNAFSHVAWFLPSSSTLWAVWACSVCAAALLPCYVKFLIMIHWFCSGRIEIVASFCTASHFKYRISHKEHFLKGSQQLLSGLKSKT